jgi:2-keto-4-pentenoate hydratase/2-oxohepta-3-ene-1,7-dioic acid hydratase in catechol pathway
MGGGSNWILWSDYAKEFSNDKVVSGVSNFLDFVKRSEILKDHLKKNEATIQKLKSMTVGATDYANPFIPLAFRDFYCFEEHVMTARKGRGLEMIPAWYEAPVFYYSNHLSFKGPFETIALPRDCKEMDCELEFACVIGKEIRNATLEEASKAIFAYGLVNDWTARDFQRWEMPMNMGPAKGKDFATSFSSFLVTPDELGAKSKKGYDVEIELKINGETFTKNNWNKIQFSFEEMIVRASKNCTLYPGEVLASGTIGGGCLLEYNITHQSKRWLQTGDQVEMTWGKGGPCLSNKVGPQE